MQITFWGNHYHQVGVTYNLVAVSAMLALNYRMKSLVTHNHFDRSALEYCFLSRDYVQNGLNQHSDVGIDGLSKFIKFNKADKDDIANYTTTLIRNKLEILTGTTITNKEVYYNDYNEVINIILTTAKLYYDIVFVDLASGMNDLSDKIFELSDIIIVNLNQNPNLLEDFFQSYSSFNPAMREKCTFIIGRYDKFSKYNLKAVQRKYGLKDNIAVIPYNIEFADACGEGKVLDFMKRNLKLDKEDLNYNFMNETRQAVELILEKLKVDISVKKIGE